MRYVEGSEGLYEDALYLLLARIYMNIDLNHRVSTITFHKHHHIDVGE